MAKKPSLAPSSNEPDAATATATPVTIHIHPDAAFKFKEIALHERKTANDVYVEAVEQYLKAKGFGAIKVKAPRAKVSRYKVST